MSKLQAVIEKLHPLERRAVPHLQDEGTVSVLAERSGLSEVEAVRALQWLGNKGCLKVDTEEREYIEVSKKGQAAHENGLPEMVVFGVLKKQGKIKVAEIQAALPDYDKGAVGSAVGGLKAAGIPFVTNSKGEPGFKYIESIPFNEPLAAKALAAASKRDWQLTITKDNLAAVKDLLKRPGYAKHVKRREKTYKLTALGKDLVKHKHELVDYDDRITAADLKTGAWKKKKYRAYDVTINVPASVPGKKHFVSEAIEYIKQVWLELGFQEMTGDMVQTGFWNLDSLFVPQDHPAREEQDTFYVGKPARIGVDPKVFKRVKDVHEHGGDTGSDGWQDPYSKDVAEELMLRTHTTVLSAQTLDMIRQGKKPLPGKYFSVAKCFRNEALDWKHLFEFFQVEGIVVDPNANFKDLIGYLKLFFKKLGFEQVRVRPAHFPYTEPSVEVEGFHPVKKQWVELGGSGLFRPEVTKTLIGREVPVLAWGLGMDRSISEYFDITDIRDLYNNDLKQLRTMKKWVK